MTGPETEDKEMQRQIVTGPEISKERLREINK